MEQIHQKVGTIILPFVQSVCVRKKAGSILKYTYKKTATVFLLQMALDADGISADCWFKFFKIISVAFCCY